MLTQLLLSLTSLLANTAPQPAPMLAGASFAVRAEQLHIGDGRIIENGVMLVRDGRIEKVGADLEVPAGTPVIEHAGHVTPGLVALRDFSGTQGEEFDSTRSIMDSASLAHAFDGDHSDFNKWAANGVTAGLLAPSRGFIGGLTAVVKPTRVLAADTHLACSMASSTFVPNVEPTSFAGALEELQARFAEPQGSFARVKQGELPMMLRVESRHEVLRAIALAKQYGIKGALVGASRSGELVDEIKASGLAVGFPCFQLGAQDRTLESVVSLAEAGVPFGFCLDAPYNDAAMLRLSAVACLRFGLDRSVALRSLTLDAATIAGVGDRVGSLAAGKDADFVLWSGNPLDLSSSVKATYIDGKRAFGGQQ